MSLQIIKAGILDTIQDSGRYGYQHLGINPGGAIDFFSAQLSNALLGKDLDASVIEMHFPASQILFEKETIICITGADFLPEINTKKIPIDQPVAIDKNRVLHFEKITSGTRCYLSVLQQFELDKWLNSYSTNIKAEGGGLNGRSLKKGDVLNYKNDIDCKQILANKDFFVLPWKVNKNEKAKNEIRFIKGNEWDWLSDESKNLFCKSLPAAQAGNYKISNNSDRMGYRLTGNELKTKHEEQLISSAVTFGTIQLLPDGQLIVLMADHQTTGGYPVIGNVISVDLPLLAQKKPNDEIIFIEVEHKFAEQQLIEQQKRLLHLQTTCKFKIEKLLNVTL